MSLRPLLEHKNPAEWTRGMIAIHTHLTTLATAKPDPVTAGISRVSAATKLPTGGQESAHL